MNHHFRLGINGILPYLAVSGLRVFYAYCLAIPRQPHRLLLLGAKYNLGSIF